ncbi:hypothetical protein [Thermococcus waiotapuensis]|uniref:DUF4870 domain-containing protein n=1 Tax=Thermococcus waiotapuensis TaxID=90909 RepID=A0AAE4SYM3_9EURY|nr:hypothetical protein [Thermococcus waiotapuensis]MDV3103884.1 hypothetical protein [Thermococcus waiotapuensis]
MSVTKTEGVGTKGTGRVTNAFIAYIFGFVGGVPLILMKDTDEFTRVHAAYSSVMGFFAWLAFMAVWHMPVNRVYPNFGPAMYVVYAWLIYAAFGMYTYLRGRTYRIPVIDRMAKGLIRALSNAV